MELVKRKILISPEPGPSPKPGPSCHVPFSTISPTPNKNKKEEKGKGQGKRTKQHSAILTSTPMKTLLENKAQKRTIKKEKEEIKKRLKTCKKEARVSKRPIKKKQTKKGGFQHHHLKLMKTYCCSCLVGNRTVGCCWHVMTLLWYLGWARHQVNISVFCGWSYEYITRYIKCHLCVCDTCISLFAVNYDYFDLVDYIFPQDRQHCFKDNYYCHACLKRLFKLSACLNE